MGRIPEERTEGNMIQIYTGDGKGKTTASMGLAARHAGYEGNRVLVMQFMKCGREGEYVSLNKLDNVTFMNNGYAHGFVFMMKPEEKERLTAEHNKNLAYVKEQAKSGAVTLIVLDELVSAYTENVIDRAAVLDLLNDHGEAELVLTGRNVPQEILDRADYISEIHCVRHPYETKKAPARKGIEY